MKDPVVQNGNAVLRLTAKPVLKKEFGTKPLLTTIEKMKKILSKEQHGVAIAAPQIGVSKRMFVVAGRAFDDGKKDSTTPDKVFINPEFVKLSRRKKEMSEGCLSVRGTYGTVLRHEKASITAYDETGKKFTYNGTELIGHIFQHEMDHLDGILYVDKATAVREDSEVAKRN
jgi:peptide deformylase